MYAERMTADFPEEGLETGHPRTAQVSQRMEPFRSSIAVTTMVRSFRTLVSGAIEEGCAVRLEKLPTAAGWAVVQ